MMKKILVLVIVLSLLLNGMLVAVGGEANDGDENVDKSIEEIEPTAVQEIYDWHDLNNTRENLTGDYVLMNDLDEDTAGYDDHASETANGGAGWKPIYGFDGILDGQGHQIKGIHIDRSTNQVGLFSLIKSPTIKNLGVSGDISGQDEVGVLFGYTGNSPRITGCFVSGSVSGASKVGGLGGDFLGLGTIDNCYSTAKVSGNDNVGGFVGRHYGEKIKHSYSTGLVDSGGNVGGFAGVVSEPVVNSYWNIETSKQDIDDGAEGRTTEEMTWEYSSDTYENWDMAEDGSAKWLSGHHATVIDHEGNWSYPSLGWQEWKEPPFAGGSGTSNYPYQIETWHHLNNTRNNLSASYELITDLNETSDGYEELVNTTDGWDPIGDYDMHNDVEFKGTFDGKGHEIRGLYINRSGKDHIGLFGGIKHGAEVNNVRLVSADVTGGSDVGALVGYNLEGTVNNSYVAGDVTGSWDVGGLVGYNDGGVSNSYARGNVSGDEIVGVLVGYSDGAVNNSYAAGNVTGDKYVGGLVGWTYEGTIENSHYNIDQVLINDGHHVTTGGLFDAQYQDWIVDKNLDIADYSDTLVPSGDHYEINDIQGLKDLLGFAGYKKYKFRLTEDLNLAGEPGLHIPYLAADLDGYNHTISNLYISRPFNANVGMFGYIRGGTVSNVGVVDTNVSGEYYIGGLVGQNYDGTVKNSFATGNVTGAWDVGGLVGYNGGEISKSYSKAVVSGEIGDDDVGGLVGYNYGIVNNSYATGNVSGPKGNTGGLIGYNYEGSVEKSYATGNVSAPQNGPIDGAGGLVGRNDYGPVNNSYAIGSVSGKNNVGGLVGKNHDGTVKNSYATGNVSGPDGETGGLVSENGGTVTNSYWNNQTSGQNTSTGGVGLTTSDMTWGYSGGAY
ncbi:MAG: GLUG motif-containing protein, partial [Thermoplasmatota archaeon]